MEERTEAEAIALMDGISDKIYKTRCVDLSGKLIPIHTYRIKIGFFKWEHVTAYEVSCMGGFLTFFNAQGDILTHFAPDKWRSFRSIT